MVGGGPDVTVLLVNTGTPDEARSGAVRRYLRSYLSDPRVVEMPRTVWLPILYGMVLPFRPGKSAAKYRSIWTEAGSPLVVNAGAVARGLSRRFSERGLAVGVDYAMCYGTPGLAAKIREEADRGVERILVLPLFPQYSPQTVGSVMDGVARAVSRLRNPPALRTVKRFWNEPGWAAMMAETIRAGWAARGSLEGTGGKLLFSYHGVPEDCVKVHGDSYERECRSSSEAIASALGLERGMWETCFQSRFGPHEWLKPYSSARVAELGAAGVPRVDVVSPSFSCDCLETLEELDIELRKTFLAANPSGVFNYIACPNGSDAAVDFYGKLLMRELQGWI